MTKRGYSDKYDSKWHFEKSPHCLAEYPQPYFPAHRISPAHLIIVRFNSVLEIWISLYFCKANKA